MRADCFQDHVVTDRENKAGETCRIPQGFAGAEMSEHAQHDLLARILHGLRKEEVSPKPHLQWLGECKDQIVLHERVTIRERLQVLVVKNAHGWYFR